MENVALQIGTIAAALLALIARDSALAQKSSVRIVREANMHVD